MMLKVAQQYLDIDPWLIRERGLHADRARVSESIFSLANEFMGVRGTFEEGYGGEEMVGSFFNGVFEEENLSQMPAFSFRGMIDRSHGLANAVNWLYTRIRADGEALDLAAVTFSEFERQTDMRTGLMRRSVVWQLGNGKRIRLIFSRFLSLVDGSLGCQRIEFEALRGACAIELRVGLDFGIPQYTQRMAQQWDCPRKQADGGMLAILGRVKRSGHCVFSSARFEGLSDAITGRVEEDRWVGLDAAFTLAEGQVRRVDRIVVNRVRRDPPVDEAALWRDGVELAKQVGAAGYDAAFAANAAEWASIWENLDIAIEGDPGNQQGIRYCLFQLYQSYHGVDPTLNVTAKGLTSEYYYGWTWWDTETYCLPFYMFNNPVAARSLLQYRHITLPGALQRARQMDCAGARYPMGTIDGTEAVAVWQHGDLEIHVSAAVAFGIQHYVQVTGDAGFLAEYGLEILLQVCRYYASRGQWSPLNGDFGFWCVMGADEFHMMAHNNYYTNFMVKQAFEYTLACMERMRDEAPADYRRIVEAAGLGETEPRDWRKMADKMRLKKDSTSGVIEQHDGYFDMPHLDLSTVPPENFPLYEHWPYLKIFRWDFIKQPDVLLAMFLHGSRFTREEKIANYAYYEPRCMHESSLSPSIHSILAAEIGRLDDAMKYFQQATRLDLDDYNRNTWQGLHTTSMAGAYMNIVYGFGGMRSDGDVLVFNPVLPATWQRLRFRVHTKGSVLELELTPQAHAIRLIAGAPVRVIFCGDAIEVTAAGVTRAARREAAPTLKAVILDLDGVIVSTDEFHYQGWKRLADEEGIPFDRAINERLRGVSRMESLAIVLEQSPKAWTDSQKAELATRKNRYYKAAIEQCLTADDILPGVMPFLEACRAAGLKLAIGSSSRNTPAILERIGLSDYFDAVADGNDITQSKPAPDVFLIAAQRLGIDPAACLVVEDAEAGVSAAVAAGMPCLAVGFAAGDARAALSADGLAGVSVDRIRALYTGGGQ